MELDQDLKNMTIEELQAEVKKLRAGLRQHRDATGHALCWYVPELWNLLPDRNDPAPPSLLRRSSCNVVNCIANL